MKCYQDNKENQNHIAKIQLLRYFLLRQNRSHTQEVRNDFLFFHINIIYIT